MYAQYYYRKNPDDTITILRCLGESGEAILPDRINNCTVTAIGPYCFSHDPHLKEGSYQVSPLLQIDEKAAYNEKTYMENTGTDPWSEGGIYLQPQAGRELTSVRLPSTLRSIGAYAFYNCRNLKSLTLPAAAEELGNDAFMNCTRLNRLCVYEKIGKPGFLQLVLAQIPWDIELHFADAAVFFPEYQEFYEEIGPAHVFEIQVEGNGYRARKCFRDGVFQLAEYDRIFPRFVPMESEKTLCRIAADRLLFPIGLTEEHQQMYGDYLKEHQVAYARRILLNREEALTERLKELEQLFAGKWLGDEALMALTETAARENIPEAAATFIQWKRTYGAKKKKSRYEFDDF